jgi:hypothetical protein
MGAGEGAAFKSVTCFCRAGCQRIVHAFTVLTLNRSMLTENDFRPATRRNYANGGKHCRGIDEEEQTLPESFLPAEYT